jgi:hypothetical protein
MCVIRRSDYDELDLRVSENIIQGSVDLGGHTKPLFDFAAFSSRVTLEHRVQCKDLWQRQDERDMEGQPSKPETKNTGGDRTRCVMEGRVMAWASDIGTRSRG